MVANEADRPNLFFDIFVEMPSRPKDLGLCSLTLM